MYCIFNGKAMQTVNPPDGSVGTAKVADDAITLAKLASGTDGNIISFDASGNPVAIATGNDGQVLTSAGAGAPPAFETAAGGYTEAGTATTTSGSSSTIDSIPAGVKDILVVIDGVSSNAAQQLYMYLGDSGGFETSGYTSTAHQIVTGTATVRTSTGLISLSDSTTAADLTYGVVHLTRARAGVHAWVSSSVTKCSTASTSFGAGSKTLSGELTQLQLLTTSTFDLGSWNVYYQ
jgi:hypothetical protein